MITCPKCGTSLPEGSKFCQKCGTKLTQDQSTASDPKNNQTANVSGSKPTGMGTPKSMSPEVKEENKGSDNSVKPVKENASSSKSVNISSGKGTPNVAESEEEETISGQSDNEADPKPVKIAKEQRPQEKSEITSVPEAGNPTPEVTNKSQTASNPDVKKDTNSPNNLSPLGKKLYELKMLNEHKIIDDEEYLQRKRKLLQDYVNS